MLWGCMTILTLISRPSLRRLVGQSRSCGTVVAQAAGGGGKFPKLSRVLEDRGIEVQQRGNSMKAKCPFHGNGQERTPSLAINDEKGLYHCFSCEASGNVAGFVAEYEGVGYSEAMDLLCREYGLVRSRPANGAPQTQAQREAAERRERTRKLLEAATAFYVAALSRPEGAACMQMLRERKVSAQSAHIFRLGFSPSAGQPPLSQHLLSLGFRQDELIDVGLAYRREGSASLVDRFRARLMIPIASAAGDIVGFGARVVPPDEGGGAKYLNSRDSPIFKKGSLLFGLPHARRAARAKDQVVLVEGYMDVIALHAAGIAHAVGCLGTAISEEQLRLAASLSPSATVILALDADAEGSQ